MSKQRSEKIKLTVFISFAFLMALVCAAISVNIIKELKNDRKMEKEQTHEIADSHLFSERKVNPLVINKVASTKPIVDSFTATSLNTGKDCEENREFYIFNFISKLFLAFTAGVIFSDGVYIKMGIV